MARYALETHQNKEMASLHFDFKVPKIGYMSSRENTPQASELKTKLLAVNGIVEVYSSQQRIHVTRGGAFTWDELTPAILGVVRDFFDIDELEEVIAYA